MIVGTRISVAADLHNDPGSCPHCLVGEPRVWDGELFHYAHPAGTKLKMCDGPWRAPRHGDMSSQKTDQRPDVSAWQREVILRNAENDLNYAPYCMRCEGLVRMRPIERHYWRCLCGAQCDYRQAVRSL